jgi:hypothetical protein
VAGRLLSEDPSSLEADLSALIDEPQRKAQRFAASAALTPKAMPAASAGIAATIASGAPPPVVDEWLGNLLYGYTPPASGRPAAPADASDARPKGR